MSPLVSIIIPNYNAAAYIRKAVDSALQQHYPHIEVIVVDDGSTDDSPSILAEYGDKIRVIRQNNAGAAAARNSGLAVAQGEYIAFLDADDRYLPENIQKKMECLLSSKGLFRWCYSNFNWVNAEGAIIRRGDETPGMLLNYKASGQVFLQALSGNLLGTNLFLMHKDVVQAAGGFDEKMIVLEDYALFLHAAYLFPIAYVDEPLVEVYQHEGSLSQSGKKKGYLSRWRLHAVLIRKYPNEIASIANLWQKKQADVYRNLAKIYAPDKPKRARVLLAASLRHQNWQPGAYLLWFSLLWR